MRNFKLTKKELLELHQAHKEARQKTSAYNAYKINTLILLGSGWKVKKVKEALLIDDETIRSYFDKYKSGGIKDLLETNHKGKSCRLTKEQQEELEIELDKEIYLTTSAVIAFVSDKFKITYTPSGMKDLLHRLGYEYKKPKLIPGKPDKEKQDFFAECYKDFMKNKPENTVVLFADAVHPEHNTMSAYGWFKKGQDRLLKTNSGRQRLNLHGTVNAESPTDMTIIESATVNRDSTLQLLEMIKEKYSKAGEIIIILDNARYHYNQEIRNYINAANNKIKLVFLPAYSPQLNLIERIWKFFKKKVLYNRYYEDVGKFRNAAIKFFNNIKAYEDELTSLLGSSFQSTEVV